VGESEMNEKIKRQLVNSYGDFMLKQLYGGYTNQMYLLERDNTSLVAKISNNTNDAKNEYECLKVLKTSLYTPNILDRFEIDNHSVLIMSYLTGVNGQGMLDSNELKKSEKIYELLGINLAKGIHVKTRSESNSNLRNIALYSDDFNDLEFIPSSLLMEVENILACNYLEESYVLIHGDYGPHNSLFNENKDSLYIIDWEWAGWGSPLHDVSWILWFLNLHYPDRANILSEVFLEAYKKHSKVGISKSTIKIYSISRVLNIMHRIIYANSEVKKEWINRLNWTLETDY
jgi:thiamine kinase-like enzyme